MFYSPVINKKTRMHKLCVFCIVQGVRSEPDFLSHFFYKHKGFHDITWMSWKSHFMLYYFNFQGHFDQSLLLYFHLLTSDCLHDTEQGTPRTMRNNKNPSLVYSDFTHLSVLQSESVVLLPLFIYLFYFKLHELANTHKGGIANMLAKFLFWWMGYY